MKIGQPPQWRANAPGNFRDAFSLVSKACDINFYRNLKGFEKSGYGKDFPIPRDQTEKTDPVRADHTM
jgi:hypothetical protein